MSYFEIRPDSVKSQVMPIQMSGITLRTYQSRILAIARDTASSDAGYAMIQETLEYLAEQVRLEAEETGRLSQGLSSIVSEYENREDSIISGIQSPVQGAFGNGANGGNASDSDKIEPDYEYAQTVQDILAKLRGEGISTQERLALIWDLLRRASLLDPENCTLTKAEKEAILRWLGPVADVAGKLGTLQLLMTKPFYSLPFVRDFLNTAGFNNGVEGPLVDLLAKTPILGLLGFEYNPATDSYFTKEGCIQQQWGFCDAIDDWGPGLGMDLDTDITTFTYNGMEFRTQLWKGTYGGGFSTGSEYGLYCRPEAEALANPYEWGSEDSRYILYDSVPQEYQPVITQRTEYFDEASGTWKSFRNCTSDYGDGDDYWSLNIRTDAGVDKSTVRVSYDVDCSKQGPDFARAMYESLLNDPNLRGTPVLNGNVIHFEY